MLLSFGLWGANADKPFTITVESQRRDLDFVKKRAELTMARNTDFCRGSLMPGPTKSWECKGISPGRDQCVLEYECKNINKNFSRVTESRRIKSDLRNIPKASSNFKILISKPPVQNIDKYQFGSLASLSNELTGTTTQTTSTAPNTSMSSQTAKSSDISIDELSELEGELDDTPAERSDKSELEDEFDQEFDDEQKGGEEILENEFEEEVPLEEESFNKDTFAEDDDFSEKPVEKDESVKEKRENNWLNFALEYINAKDDFENTVSVIGFAYTPHLWFSKSWGGRFQLGYHNFEDLNITPSETFSIIEYGAYVIYQLDNLYGELGYGLQNWGNTAGDSFSFLGLGLGYRFDKPQLGFIDRLYFDYISIGDEAGTTELRFSLGVTF